MFLIDVRFLARDACRFSVCRLRWFNLIQRYCISTIAVQTAGHPHVPGGTAVSQVHTPHYRGSYVQRVERREVCLG